MHSLGYDSPQLDINIQVVGMDDRKESMEISVDTALEDTETSKDVGVLGSNIDITVTPPSA